MWAVKTSIDTPCAWALISRMIAPTSYSEAVPFRHPVFETKLDISPFKVILLDRS
jgi:hypothetical protein